MSEIKVEGEAVAKNEDSFVTQIRLGGRPLHATLSKEIGEGSFYDAVFKADGTTGASTQGVSLGRKLHPFNFDMLGRFQSVNVHHGRSIHAKVAATVGLGFETPNDRKKKDAKVTGVPLRPSELPADGDIASIDRLLNPLCSHSWQDTLNDVAEDFWQSGNGYLEVVRDDAGTIVGIHHLPARETYVVIEDNRYNRHYAIQGSEDSSGNRLFAKFGDLNDFLKRFGKGTNSQSFGFVTGPVNKDTVSEVIHFRRPTSLSRWYGFPDWLAAVAYIELAQCLVQHEYDFYLNRGVPEFMLFILGQQLNSKDKQRIETAMQSTIGLGNQHKSILVNLPNAGKDMTVQLEKLALEGKSDGSLFASMTEALALQVVSAHGVPPLLAGIQIPGKLGAANEMIQAMQAFQTLVISPVQRLFRQTLSNTLVRDGTTGVTDADLVLNTILDEIDVARADTMARMRQSPQEAESEGRDLDEGLKKMDDEQRGALLREAIDGVLDRLISRSAA